MYEFMLSEYGFIIVTIIIAILSGFIPKIMLPVSAVTLIAVFVINMPSALGVFIFVLYAIVGILCSFASLSIRSKPTKRIRT